MKVKFEVIKINKTFDDSYIAEAQVLVADNSIQEIKSLSIRDKKGRVVNDDVLTRKFVDYIYSCFGNNY